MKELTTKAAATIGLDLAKAVFQAHGVDDSGRRLFSRSLKRAEVVAFFAAHPPCLVGMEACSGAHHWARQLQALGHQVRLIPPQYVRPYVKRQKTDANDAAAIAEAVRRPDMRFVAIKSVEQQVVLAQHRVREGLCTQRTALSNRIRGLLAEFGIVVPRGMRALRERLAQLVAPQEGELPGAMHPLLAQLQHQLGGLEKDIAHTEQAIQQWHRANAASQRLAETPGIGYLTATATVASCNDARQYRSARQFGAALGITPRQYSSGGRVVLGGISRQGDGYLRRLYIHGARAVVRSHERRALQQPMTAPGWLHDILKRRPKNVAIVAQAHRNMRIAWALLTHPERRFDAQFKPGAHNARSRDVATSCACAAQGS
jgi:transposase